MFINKACTSYSVIILFVNKTGTSSPPILLFLCIAATSPILPFSSASGARRTLSLCSTALQYSTVQCIAVQSSAVQCIVVQFTGIHCTALHCTLVHCILFTFVCSMICLILAAPWFSPLHCIHLGI